ncbi:hypothetical protein YN1HA_18470 [Sulfurisphaera ohwakuensis]
MLSALIVVNEDKLLSLAKDDKEKEWIKKKLIQSLHIVCMP